MDGARRGSDLGRGDGRLTARDGSGRLRVVFEGQWLHALFLVVAGGGVLAATRWGRAFGGEPPGDSTAGWFLAGLAVAVAHQVYVWLCWRLELHLGLVSRALGRAGFESAAGSASAAPPGSTTSTLRCAAGGWCGGGSSASPATRCIPGPS